MWNITRDDQNHFSRFFWWTIYRFEATTNTNQTWDISNKKKGGKSIEYYKPLLKLHFHIANSIEWICQLFDQQYTYILQYTFKYSKVLKTFYERLQSFYNSCIHCLVQLAISRFINIEGKRKTMGSRNPLHFHVLYHNVISIALLLAATEIRVFHVLHLFIRIFVIVCYSLVWMYVSFSQHIHDPADQPFCFKYCLTINNSSIWY